MTNISDGNSETRVMSAIKSLRSGNGILVIDNPDRENEADLIFSTDFLSVEQIARMIRDCSGIICLCLTPEKTKSLGLKMMAEENSSRFGTNFTVSIDAKNGITTGVSASDRLATIKTACAKEASISDLAIPGHIFPLRADSNGVLGRDGHTEATIDLMRLSNLSPSGVLCELTNPDGSMARNEEITAYSQKYGFPIVSIEDIKLVRKKYGYDFIHA